MKCLKIDTFGLVRPFLKVDYIVGIQKEIENYFLDKYITTVTSSERGECLVAQDYPQKICLNPRERLRSDLPFFSIGGAWAVNKQFASILQKFDLGNKSLFPVEVLKSDRKTPVDGNMSFFNICEHKTAFSPKFSKGIEKAYDDDRDLWEPKHLLQQDEIAVTAQALNGPDVWVDSRLLWSGFFLSDRLVAAVREARIDKPLCLYRCRVLLEN